MILYAVVHSALASLPVKERVRATVGDRASDGLYRFGFNGFAVLSFAATLRYIWRLPDRTLYRARGWWAAPFYAGQLACVLALLETNRQNGWGRVTGLRHLWSYLAGRDIPTPPVAQHPPPKGECLEGWTGPFRMSSHPNNYLVLLLYWLSPVMNVKWAAIGMVTGAYMVLGSLHEDRRLLSAYGDRYACYHAQVPHVALWPRTVRPRRASGLSQESAAGR